ncbi:MAG: 3-dehydroquinate synthase [Erysipelotrichaceae bacterium]|nr:3-dehydroquinate synthase [Erysipelotrichaceae bacterium]
MKIVVDLQERSYPIYIEKGILKSVNQYVNLQRKVLIVTDSGVPSVYSECVQMQCKEATIVCIEQGESSKNIENYQALIQKMLELEFSRKDLMIAVGGGVVGDLCGFVASTYMRGIDFINIPTTTLAQVDSSIGGKTAIDLGNVKNCIGSFYQPKAVFIDPKTLDTLSNRHFYSGLVEALKSGAIYDQELFELLEDCDVKEQIEEILYRSLMVKKAVVEIDEKELGLRKILNFGHTLGHGIESASNYELLHGEAVSLGMVKMVEDENVRKRLVRVLEKWNMPLEYEYDKQKSFEYMLHDKKKVANMVSVVQVKEIGQACIIDMTQEELKVKF